MAFDNFEWDCKAWTLLTIANSLHVAIQAIVAFIRFAIEPFSFLWNFDNKVVLSYDGFSFPNFCASILAL